MILTKIAIPAQRHEIGEGVLHIVAEMRALRVARDLRLLPRAERGVEPLEHVRALRLELRKLVTHVDLIAPVGALIGGTKFGDLRLQLGHRLLEIQKSQHSRLLSRCRPPRKRP